MTTMLSSAAHHINRKQWLALALALSFGLGLLALLLAGLRPSVAAAAGLAEPAASYACTEAGLNSALAAGGSATFTCAVPTTVTVSGRKTVVHNGTLDGGNKLILSGGGLTGVFTVAAGVHLSLLNLSLSGSSAGAGAGLYNNGVLNVTNVAFLNNTANAGAAIYNDTGTLTVTNSSFTHNDSGSGGAIYDNALLRVDNSRFVGNFAGSLIVNGPSAPAVLPNGGGAIYVSPVGDALITGSSFTANVGQGGGGAVLFGPLPTTSVLTDSHRLTIDSSEFDNNCTAREGGAVAASLHVVVSNSTFQNNLADASQVPCQILQDSQPGGQAPAPSTPVVSDPIHGSGGAIFSSYSLEVSASDFLTNSATITQFSGGGALLNYSGGVLSVATSSFSGNFSHADGGAILVDGVSAASVVASSFSDNLASGGLGGAIGSYGALTVSDSQFTGNRQQNAGLGGGAIFSEPAFTTASAGPNGRGHSQPPQAPQGLGPTNFLSVDHSTFTANTSDYEGGAIDGGPAVISRSTFVSNTAAYGGAIDVLNPFTMTADTFSNNAVVTTTAYGASRGGAIDAGYQTVLIVNSTFYHNRAQGSAVGGAINADFPPVSTGSSSVNGTFTSGSTTISYSTLVSNTADAHGFGGAIYQQGSGLATLTDVLLAYSGGGDCNTTVNFSGANLEFGDASCGAATLTSNPLALAPANNGGPTLTSALLPASPAINAGDNGGCPSTDQRGAHRPVGGTCDIGAFEFGGSVPFLWLPIARK